MRVLRWTFSLGLDGLRCIACFGCCTLFFDPQEALTHKCGDAAQ